MHTQLCGLFTTVRVDNIKAIYISSHVKKGVSGCPAISLFVLILSRYKTLLVAYLKVESDNFFCSFLEVNEH